MMTFKQTPDFLYSTTTSGSNRFSTPEISSGVTSMYIPSTILVSKVKGLELELHSAYLQLHSLQSQLQNERLKQHEVERQSYTYLIYKFPSFSLDSNFKQFLFAAQQELVGKIYDGHEVYRALLAATDSYSTKAFVESSREIIETFDHHLDFIEWLESSQNRNSIEYSKNQHNNCMKLFDIGEATTYDDCIRIIQYISNLQFLSFDVKFILQFINEKCFYNFPSVRHVIENDLKNMTRSDTSTYRNIKAYLPHLKIELQKLATSGSIEPEIMNSKDFRLNSIMDKKDNQSSFQDKFVGSPIIVGQRGALITRKGSSGSRYLDFCKTVSDQRFYGKSPPVMEAGHWSGVNFNVSKVDNKNTTEQEADPIFQFSTTDSYNSSFSRPINSFFEEQNSISNAGPLSRNTPDTTLDYAPVESINCQDSGDYSYKEHDSFFSKEESIKDNGSKYKNDKDIDTDKQKDIVSGDIELNTEKSISTINDNKSIKLNKREANLNRKEVNLKEREANTNEREASLIEREVNLNEREVNIERKEADLEKKDINLDKKEINLDKKEVNIDKKEVELNKREVSIGERESHLNIKAETLKKMELHLKEKESELEEKVSNLKEKESNLKEREVDIHEKEKAINYKCQGSSEKGVEASLFNNIFDGDKHNEEGLLASIHNEISVKESSFSKVVLCLIDNLPKHRSHNYAGALVVIDSSSKGIHIWPTRHKLSTGLILKLFIERFIPLHGVPSEVCKYGSNFPLDKDDNFKKFFSYAGSACKTTNANDNVSIRRSKSNYKEYSFPDMIISYIRFYASKLSDSEWPDFMSLAEYTANASSYDCLGDRTPFEVLYGSIPSYPKAFPKSRSNFLSSLSTGENLVYRLNFYGTKAKAALKFASEESNLDECSLPRLQAQ